MPLSCAIYSRVASSDGGDNLARQEEECRRLVERLGYDVVGIYSDVVAALGEPRPLRCVTYCRISQDRESEERGVTRQEEDCRELAAAQAGAPLAWSARENASEASRA
jgi:DNA invertase Pin-like site-specific DNA recombinase